MTIKFTVPGKERKRLVKTLADWLGVEAKYNGAPTFSYEVDYFTIDRDGGMTFDDRADSEVIERLMEHLYDEGFQFETQDAEPSAAASDDETEPHGYGLTVSLPATAVNETNLSLLLDAKGSLIKSALGIEDIRFTEHNGIVSFPWFEGRELDAEEVKAYTHFIAALCDMTREQKRVTAKEKPIDNEKYAFRCFLLRLGFIGAEYKAERKLLLQRLSGSSAFKNGGASVEISE